MRIFKKLLVSICILIVTLLSLVPSTANAAELTDAQRQAIVNVVKELVEDGNKNGILRYSQDHRSSGFSWTKVRNHSKQTTVSTWNLTKDDQDRVIAALKQDVLKRYPRDEAMQAKYAALTRISTSYKCRTLGADIYDTIAFDCSSLASAAYSMTYGTSFLWTTYGFQKESSSIFNKTSVTNAKPGDVLWKSGHVAIYLGQCYNNDTSKSEAERKATYIAEAGGISSAGTPEKKAKVSKILADFLIEHPTYIKEHPNYNAKAGLPVVELPEDCIRAANKQVVIRRINLNNCEFTAAYSYTGEVGRGKAIDVSATTTTNTGTNTGGLTVDQVNNSPIVIGSGTSTLGYWPDNYKLEDQALANSEGYFHKGTPAYGGYTATVSTLTWLLEKASDVLDWLAGFITMALKMQVIGWTAMVENLISNGLAWGTQDVNAQTPTSTGSIINDTTNLPIVTTNKVTVEDIIFNNVPLLDINFFDFANAAGQELSQNSVIYKIRQLISQWYYTFRVLAIMLMFIILIYNIVKLVATTAVAEKTNAKEKVKDWLVAFIIVFTIHYFMVAVIAVNNQIVQILKPIVTTQSTGSNESSEWFATDIENGSITQNNEESLYEQIRVQAYDVRAVTGWTGTFMYVIMVIYLFMFVVMYIKRLFITAILTVVSPLVGALYAVNKSAYPINRWVKEYTYNVLIQLIHALVYTVLISVALSLAKVSTIVGGFFALLMIGFIFTAEKIVKQILGYKSAELGGLGDSLGAQFALYMGAKNFTRRLGRTANTVVQTGKDISEHRNSEKKKRIAEEQREQQDVLDAGYARNIAGVRAMLTVSGKTLKDAFSNATDGEGFKGDYANRLSAYGKKTKSVFKEIYKQYLKEAQMGTYRGSREWQDRAKRMHQESDKAKKAFIMSRSKGLLNSVIATAGMTIGIPLLFLDRGKGLAVTAAGVNAFRNAFTRKRISGRKSYKYDLKGKKLLFFFASPALAPGYANAMANIIEERDIYKTKYGDALDALDKAKEIEVDILSKMQEMYSGESTNTSTGESEQLTNQAISDKLDAFKQKVNETEEKDLKRALDKSLTKISQDDVEKEVTQYMKEKNISRLSMGDYDNIRDRVNRKLKSSGHEVQISDSFTNNIREQVRREVGMNPQVQKTTKDKEGKEKTELKARVEVKDIAKICREIAKDHEKQVDDSIIKEMVIELKKDKGFRAVMETQNTEKIIEKVKDKLDEKIKDNELAEAISRSFEQKMDEHIEQKTKEEEKTVDEIVNNLRGNRAVHILTQAINTEGGMTVELKNSRYNELMKDVKRLDEINETYYDLTGEKIYKDVAKLVEGFRNDLLSNRRKS